MKRLLGRILDAAEEAFLALSHPCVFPPRVWKDEPEHGSDGEGDCTYGQRVLAERPDRALFHAPDLAAVVVGRWPLAPCDVPPLLRPTRSSRAEEEPSEPD